MGRIVPEKGEHYLIQAFKQLETDKKLVIAGGASDTDDYMKQLKELASDNNRIIFTGFVQGELLQELYSNAYVYVLPSDLEGMPLSLLEAMSFGNCCLTSDIPECTEVIGHHGFSFKKGNVEDLKEKLQELCKQESTVQDYQEKASDYICRKYDWDVIVQKTLMLYQE
ncbi:glycosyltransferase [Faecalibacterium sp. An192]|uniref:glycosyltransferase family 4 protein n=1 Tax=Faecalibacterium sp. An192 TaxID=1965581 RepID=UPI0031B8A74C